MQGLPLEKNFDQFGLTVAELEVMKGQGMRHSEL